MIKENIEEILRKKKEEALSFIEVDYTKQRSFLTIEDETNEKKTNLKKQENTVGKNALLNADGTWRQLNKKECNLRYMYILANLKISSDKDEAKKNSYCDGKKTVKRDYLSMYVDSIYNNICEKNKIKSNEMDQLLEKLFSEKPLGGKKLLLLVFSHSFGQNYTRRATTTSSELLIRVTYLAEKIGRGLLEFTLNHHPILSPFITFYKGNNLINISRKNKDIFDQYIKALLTEKKDDNFFDEFYKTFVDFAMPKDTNLFKELVKNYMLDLVYTNYKQNNTPYSSLLNILEENDGSFDIVYYRKQLLNTLIKLGTLIIEYGQIDYSDNLPALFKQRTDMVADLESNVLLVVNPEFAYRLFGDYSCNKPLLSYSNIDYLRKCTKYQKIAQVLYQNKSSFIHKNPHISLEIDRKNILHTYRPMFKFSLNRNTYNMFTKLYKSIYQEEISQDEFRRRQRIFCSMLYDIDCSFMNDDIHLEDYTSVIDRLLLYALDFENACSIVPNFDKTLLNDINKLDRNYSYIDLYNKARTQRLSVRGFIKDCDFYYIYKYFIYDIYLDSRARRYFNIDTMNIQNFSFGRAMINPHRRCRMTPDIYEKFRDIYCQCMDDTDIRKEIGSISYEAYIEHTTALEIEYIESYLIPLEKLNAEQKIVFDQIRKLLYNKDDSFIKTGNKFDILEKISLVIKDKNTILYMYSQLVYHIKKDTPEYDHLESYYQLDASMSGMQMLSMSNGDDKLANSCGLIGREKHKDLYKEVSGMMFDNLDLCWSFCQEALRLFTSKAQSIIFNNDTPLYRNIDAKEFKEAQKAEDVLAIYFFTMDLESSTYTVELLNLMYDYLVKNKYQISKLNTQKYGWLWTKKITERCLKTNKFKGDTRELQSLIILISCVQLVKSLICLKLYNNTGFRNYRGLFKHALMTFFYNSTNYGRKEVFLEKIREFTGQLNLKDKICMKAEKVVVKYLDKFFIQFMNKKLPTNRRLFDISDVLCLLKKPIIIKNELFTMTYSPKATEVTVLNTRSSTVKMKSGYTKKIRGNQLHVHVPLEKFSKEEFSKAFIPNYIHFIDATLATHFSNTMENINDKLAKANIDYRVNYSTQHDCFVSNVKPFLRATIKNSYLYINKQRPINWVLSSLDEETRLEVEAILKHSSLDIKYTDFNTGFVKH